MEIHIRCIRRRALLQRFLQNFRIFGLALLYYMDSCYRPNKIDVPVEQLRVFKYSTTSIQTKVYRTTPLILERAYGLHIVLL